MKMNHPFTRLLALFLSAVTFFTSLGIASAQAAMVGTETLVQQEQLQYDRHRLNALLERDEAVQTLQSLGVDPEMVHKRVANMTQEELVALNQQMDDMQAGGTSALGVVILVFVILILLDLLGVTDIFPAIHPIDTYHK